MARALKPAPPRVIINETMLSSRQFEPYWAAERLVCNATVLCQCRQMPKAYRSDVITHSKFQAELGKIALRRERVRCPVEGCECTYELYGCQPSSRDHDITTLQGRLNREHPSHTSEVLAVNAFRRNPR